MEHHEDNAHFENVAVHNSQNLMENLQFGNNQQEREGVVGYAAVGDQSEAIVGSGLGLGIGCAVDNAGCKFEEHIERGDGADDEELKYIQEKNQSEKQQHHHYDLLKSIGNGNGSGHNDDALLTDQLDELHVMGNGAEKTVYNGSDNVVVGNEVGDEEEVEIIKNDGDFSTTSNATTSTQSPASPDDRKDVVADLLQVEMEIKATPQLPDFEVYMSIVAQEELDEEEQSSLATNGTSSLSENQLQPQAPEPQPFAEDEFVHERPVELNFDHHSILNPEAKEFVPSIGSNTASPTTALPGADFGMGAAGDSVIAHSHKEQLPHPTSSEVARHIFGEQRRNDDFVAQSPHKERCVDMEAISLPGENEFEHEAARRPHELEKEEMLLGEEDNVENVLVDNTFGGGDCQDFNRQSPVSFIDHGPETSVDNDCVIDVPMQPVDDVMKQSIYVENTHNVSDEQIEHLLNTVQPLPSECESLNSSFTDEKEFIQQMANEKQMFNAELNIQNDFNNDTHPTDVSTMEHPKNSGNVDSPVEEEQKEQLNLTVEERSFLVDTSNPFDNNVSLLAETEAPFESVRNAAPNMDGMFEEQTAVVMPPQTLSIGDNDAQDLFKHSDDSNITPSPHSTEEKHLVEETKEAQQLFPHDDLTSLGQNLDDMHLIPSTDGNIAQMEPTAHIAAAINQTANAFSDFIQSHEPEKVITQSSMVEPIRNEQISTNEQISRNEQISTKEQIMPQEQPEDAHYFGPEPVNEVAVQLQETKENTEETIAIPSQPPIVKENTTNVETAAVVAVAAAATLGGVVATKSTPTVGGAASIKKSTSRASTVSASTTAKSKISGDAKKPLEAKKSTVTLTARPAVSATTTARPRTAPVRQSIDKPTTTSSTSAVSVSASASAKSAVARKTFTAKPAPKTSAAPRAATTTASKTTTTNAARPASATATTARSLGSATNIRKNTLTSNSATLVGSKSRLNTVNGNNLSPRAKQSTLGTTTSSTATTTKPKNHISPRATLTSQMRKTSGVMSAKSPTKTSGTGTELTTKASSSSLASRTKSSTSSNINANSIPNTTTTTTTTTTTKRFVARPAPKFTATTSSATRHNTNGAASKTTIAASKKLSNSPSKTSTSPKLSPIKSTDTTGKSPKAKEETEKKVKELQQQQDGGGLAFKLDELKTNGAIDEQPTAPHLNGNNTIENDIHNNDNNEHMLMINSEQNNIQQSNSPEVINLIDN